MADTPDTPQSEQLGNCTQLGHSIEPHQRRLSDHPLPCVGWRPVDTEEREEPTPLTDEQIENLRLLVDSKMPGIELEARLLATIDALRSPPVSEGEEPCEGHDLVLYHGVVECHNCNRRWVSEGEEPPYNPRCSGCGKYVGHADGCPFKAVMPISDDQVVPTPSWRQLMAQNDHLRKIAQERADNMWDAMDNLAAAIKVVAAVQRRHPRWADETWEGHPTWRRCTCGLMSCAERKALDEWENADV